MCITTEGGGVDFGRAGFPRPMQRSPPGKHIADLRRCIVQLWKSIWAEGRSGSTSTGG